jgi:hypothetical protein
MDNPNDDKDNREAQNQTAIAPDNIIKDFKTPEHRIVSSASNVPTLI